MNWNLIFSFLKSYSSTIFWDLELFLRIFIAMILGMLIGNERKHRNKSAGMRTHAVVALGSALIMVVSKYGFADTVQGDGARLAAQVVSGVGFLGAGMIFVKHNLVSGLTTAAGIWATAGIGLTVGAGMYSIGISSALLIVIMQNVSHKLPALFSNMSSGGLIRMTIQNKPGALEDIKGFLTERKVNIQTIQITKTEKERIKLELDVIYPNKLDKTALFCTLSGREDVLFIGE